MEGGESEVGKQHRQAKTTAAQEEYKRDELPAEVEVEVEVEQEQYESQV